MMEEENETNLRIDGLKREIHVNAAHHKKKIEEKCWVAFEKMVREALHAPHHPKTGLHVIERMTYLKQLKSQYTEHFQGADNSVAKIIAAGYGAKETVYQLEQIAENLQTHYTTAISEINTLTYFKLDNER